MSGTETSTGAIRAADGAFAKMEAAHEDEYFFKLVTIVTRSFNYLITNLQLFYLKCQTQLDAMKKKKIDDTSFQEKSIRDHKEGIKRHMEAIAVLTKKQYCK